MKWEDLDYRQKGALAQLYIKNGITSLDDMKKHYNSFDGEDQHPIYNSSNIKVNHLDTPDGYWDNFDYVSAEKAGAKPDKRGHLPDKYKKDIHPSSPKAGTFQNNNRAFELSDWTLFDSPRGVNNTLFGLYENGDGRVIPTYKGSRVLPEMTVTPKGNYIHDTYDSNVISYAKGGHLFDGKTEPSQWIITSSQSDDDNRRSFEDEKRRLQYRLQEANENAGLLIELLEGQHRTAVTYNKDYGEVMPLINLPAVEINGGKRNERWNAYHDAHAKNVAKAQEAVQKWDDRDSKALGTMMMLGMTPLAAANPLAFATGAIGGGAVDAGVRTATDYEGFGDLMSNTIHGSSDYSGLYDWLNPGYLMGGRGARLDNKLFGRTPLYSPHATDVKTNGFGEPVGGGFHIGTPPVSGGALAEEQLNAFEAVHHALGRSGRPVIEINDPTHFAVKTADGWALSSQEGGVVSSELSKVNGASIAERGGVREYEVIRSGENYYLVKNNKDTTFDVLSVGNIDDYARRGITEDADIFSSLREQAGNNGGRGENHIKSRIPEYTDNKRLVDGYGHTDNKKLSFGNRGQSEKGRSDINGPSDRNGSPRLRNVQVIDEVESAIKDSKGNVLGFNVDGNIHLFPKGMNPETPIHEYSEVWGRALQQNNPEGWANVRSILKTDAKTEGIWKEVLGDKAYAKVHGDEDALAIEVLGRFSGKRGAERMQELGKTSRGRELLQKVQKFLEKAWNLIATDLFKIKDFKNADNIADKALYDMVNGTKLGKVKSDVGFDIEPSEGFTIQEIIKSRYDAPILDRVLGGEGVHIGDKYYFFAEDIPPEKGSITDLSYSDMSPKEAYAEAMRDLKRIEVGGTVGLMHGSGLSTDSAPMLYNLMQTKYTPNFEIKPITYKGRQKMVWLNNYGRIDGTEAKNRLDRYIEKLNKDRGLYLPEAEIYRDTYSNWFFIPAVTGKRLYQQGGHLFDGETEDSQKLIVGGQEGDKETYAASSNYDAIKMTELEAMADKFAVTDRAVSLTPFQRAQASKMKGEQRSRYVEEMDYRNRTGKSEFMKDINSAAEKVNKAALIAGAATGAAVGLPALAYYAGPALAQYGSSVVLPWLAQNGVKTAAGMMIGGAGATAVDQSIKDKGHYNDWADMAWTYTHPYGEQPTELEQSIYNLTNPGWLMPIPVKGGARNIALLENIAPNRKLVHNPKALKEIERSVARSFLQQKKDYPYMFEPVVGSGYIHTNTNRGIGGVHTIINPNGWDYVFGNARWYQPWKWDYEALLHYNAYNRIYPSFHEININPFSYFLYSPKEFKGILAHEYNHSYTPLYKDSYKLSIYDINKPERAKYGFIANPAINYLSPFNKHKYKWIGSPEELQSEMQNWKIINRRKPIDRFDLMPVEEQNKYINKAADRFNLTREEAWKTMHLMGVYGYF